ncbi:MAG: SLBB domain-containing protein [Bacteroidota bacterium]
MNRTFRILTMLLCMGYLSLGAQTPIPPDVQTELNERNIDEAELRSRLLARGIDIDNIAPEDLPAIQPEIEAVIAELEAENRASAAAAVGDTLPPAEVQNIQTPGTPVEGQPAAGQESSDTPQIYGHDIFSNGSLIVQSGGDDVRPPDSYRLGSGDVLVVSIFGRSQADLQFNIGPDGYIRPDRMPRIYLKGIALSEARTLLERRFGQYYVFGPGEFAVTVSEARSITVNVFGELVQSGSYTLSALNTAFNALVAAGGPSELGSVRQIKLIRAGEEVKLLDVYAFLADPTYAEDFSLQQNDVVFVPPAENVVTIGGAIRRPGRYELLPNEGLEQLIQFAGGTAADGLDGRARVVRLEDGRRQVLDFRRSEQGGDPRTTGAEQSGDPGAPGSESTLLVDGDFVEILAVEDPEENFVAVDGEVDLPGRYEFREGLRISYLIDQGRLRPSSRRDLAFLLRVNPDGTRRLIQVNPQEIMTNPGGPEDILLQNNDRLQVFASRTYVDDSFISVAGSVRQPLDSFPYPNDQAMTLAEALILAGGLLPNAATEGFIIRTDPSNQQRQSYLEVDLRAVTEDPGSAENIILQPFDRIIVYASERYAEQFEVEVNGAVREPGSYVYDPSLGVGELIRLAGGFTLDAHTDRIEVFRLQYDRNSATRTIVTTLSMTQDMNLLSPADFVLQPFDRVIVRSVSEFEAIQEVVIRGEVAYPGNYAILQDNERISDLIQRAGGLTQESFADGATMSRPSGGLGDVVLNLDEVIKNPSTASNVVLQAGDTITIPKRQELVTIIVAGTRARDLLASDLVEDGQLVVAYQGRHSAEWYINRYAGGFDGQIARKRWTTVRYPNGQVRETKKFFTLNDFPDVLPGSIIQPGLRPPRPERDPEQRTNWGEIVQTSLQGITSVVTLLVLINRL